MTKDEDAWRSYYLYHYLCSQFALVYKKNGEINDQQTAKNLGDENLRRMVARLFSQPVPPPNAKDWPPELPRKKTTTGDLVELLTYLRENNQSVEDQNPSLRVPSPDDILTALYKLVELAPAERRSLGLPDGDGLTLLQRSLLVLQTTGGLQNYEMLLQIYKSAVGLDFTQAEAPLSNLKEVDDLIETVVNQALPQVPTPTGKSGSYRSTYPSREKSRQTRIQELTRKAKREIRRLLARSGNQQLAGAGDGMVNIYIEQYLRPSFVRKLTQTLVTNEQLTDQFPVYLKRITLLPVGPLPFADKQFSDPALDDQSQEHDPYPPLLNLDLHRFNQPSGPGDYELASQEATRVIVEFYVKVPEGYEPIIGLDHLSSADCRRIDFTVSSTGIGGALSHVIKVINKALLHDIPCLAEYFPIAHDVTATQAIIRDNVASPVWAHSLVKLCRRHTLGETLKAFQHETTKQTKRNNFTSYEDFSFADPLAQGDYCGFDFLLSQAQAALQARLKAIRNASVRPEDYIQQICQRQERSLAMEEARDCLQGYPFSTLAMIGLIHSKLLASQTLSSLAATDPDVHFEAYLTIIEALLEEGVYRLALDYLRGLSQLEEVVAQGLEEMPSQDQPLRVFSGTVIIRYLICLAHYYYLCDPKDKAYLPPDCPPDANRQTLVQKAWSTLEKAQRHVSLRLRKYVALNEVSQGTFYPHYLLLSRILFLRTQLLLFFPRELPFDEKKTYLPTDASKANPPQRTPDSIHAGRLYLAEKARLYAAASGDSEAYACYAAMQAWIYLIAAYSQNGGLQLREAGKSNSYQMISSESCLDWAQKLRDHALIAYADVGRQAYYQIKEKSGLPVDTVDTFGFYQISKIPAIFEKPKGQAYPLPQEREDDLLVLDMSLLSVDPQFLPKLSPHPPTRNIYLFGTRACYLFFIRGLWMLCSDVNHEFDHKPTSQAENINWEAKFRHASRLLNVAWAMAEEGGSIDQVRENGEWFLQISRSFSQAPAAEPDKDKRFSAQEIDSIRDLYPQRIGEIADLAKVFAVASMVLRLFLVKRSDDRAALETGIDQLLASLQKLSNLPHSRTQRELLKQQEHYNSHLDSYLTKVATHLREFKSEALSNSTENSVLEQAREIQERRNRLVKRLFSALI